MITEHLSETPVIAIIGAGTIGMAWSVVFASAGLETRLFDAGPGQAEKAKETAARRLADLANHGLIEEDLAAILARIHPAETLDEALSGASHVQENVPEDLSLKHKVLADVLATAPRDCVIASSTSFIEPTRLFSEMPGRERCLVIHPGNPPFLIRVTEIVPAPFTAPETTSRAEALMAHVDMGPVRVNHEPEGFAFNRLQGALLREAYCLVRDGIVTPDEIDRMVRDGLGLRLSVTGPFENADLNAPGGIEGHAERMGPSYYRLGQERGQDDPWTADMVATVSAARRAKLPMDDRAERAAWRDQAVMRVMKARKDAGV